MVYTAANSRSACPSIFFFFFVIFYTASQCSSPRLRRSSATKSASFTAAAAARSRSCSTGSCATEIGATRPQRCLPNRSIEYSKYSKRRKCIIEPVGTRSPASRTLVAAQAVLGCSHGCVEEAGELEVRGRRALQRRAEAAHLLSAGDRV